MQKDNEQLAAVCRQLIDYISSHREEVSKLIKSEEGERFCPWRSTETYSLDLEVEGHTLGWEVVYIMDQDGGEDDPEGEFYIDGENMEGRWECKELWELDSLLTDIARAY